MNKMSNGIPMLYIDIKQTKKRWPTNRPQKFYFVARDAGNFKPLCTSETYTNEADCVTAASKLGSHQTTVFLRQAEHGDQVLRYSTLINPMPDQP